MLRNGANNNEGIIRVLRNRTREITNKRVGEEPIARGLKKKLLENINNNVEEKRGEGIALAKAAATSNPRSRDPI
jgi:predicted house-cleaning noncanonical NTP pyrophosphatase (MazG superfamily)